MVSAGPLERGDKATIARLARVNPSTVTMVLGKGLRPGADKRYGKNSRNVWAAYERLLQLKKARLERKREKLITRFCELPPAELARLVIEHGIPASAIEQRKAELLLADAILAQLGITESKRSRIFDRKSTVGSPEVSHG